MAVAEVALVIPLLRTARVEIRNFQMMALLFWLAQAAAVDKAAPLICSI
jgi:hypothetical protein